MALMPVSKISETTVRWVKGTDGWWMERHSPPDTASFSSITAPKTLNIRPRSLFPTGTFRWWPRSSTGEPRASPWVGVRAMPRTISELRWVTTSMTMLPSGPAASCVVNGRKPLGETHIHHAAADGHHRADLRFLPIRGFHHGGRLHLACNFLHLEVTRSGCRGKSKFPSRERTGSPRR